MKNKLFKKGIVIWILFLFISMSITSSARNTVEKTTKPATLDGNTLYVGGSGPNNYTTIQSAIDDANTGDTVFVYDDSSPYYEYVRIGKSINLIGEDRTTTEIIGGDDSDTFRISADYVNISGFSILNTGHNYYAQNCMVLLSKYISISNNYFGLAEAGGIIVNEGFNSIFNNIIDVNSYWAILLNEGSSNNTILGNTFLNTGSSVDIRSSNNIITLNIFKNFRLNIGLASSPINNEISHNQFVKCSLSLESKFNTIINNSFTNDGIWVHTTPNTFSNNSINNKPLLYLDGKSDLTINQECGQIILVNCNNIIVTNQIISHTSLGILLFNCDNCSIIDNDFLSNTFGIGLYSSKNTLISNNRCNDNYDGIYIESTSHYNIISENTINSNYFNGIICEGSYNKILNNTLFDNVKEDFYFYHMASISIMSHRWTCGYNIISGNIISSNHYVGISLNAGAYYDTSYDGPFNNLITDNIISNHDNQGILLINANNNTISGNHIDNNNEGIHIHKSSSNTISSNNFIDNQRDAKFVNCKDNYWDSNYWNGRLRFLKIIFGTIVILFFIPIPWINIDWHPAKEPYEI